MTTSPMYLTQHAMQRCEQRHISAEALRAATLFGDRFVQPDGTVVQLVTQRAALRIAKALGLSPGYVHSVMQGVYVVIRRSGATVTVGRRFAGAQGRIRRS